MNNETEARNSIAPEIEAAVQTLRPGALMTGYVLVTEILDPETNDYRVLWLTGTGGEANDEEDERAGLMHHKIVGMLWDVEQAVTAHRRAWTGDEE